MGSRITVILSLHDRWWKKMVSREKLLEMGGFDARARTDSHSLSDAWAKYPLAVMVHLADMEDTWLAGKGGKTE